jgi:hypothetical protein
MMTASVNRLTEAVEATINRDLLTETVCLPGLVKAFCLPR